MPSNLNVINEAALELDIWFTEKYLGDMFNLNFVIIGKCICLYTIHKVMK